MRIKAIASDVDGTITDSLFRLDLSAIRAIRRAEACRIPVILASGRPLEIVEVLSRYIGATGPMIAENGGIVKNPKTGEIIVSGDLEKAERAYKIIKAKLGDIRRIEKESRKTDVLIIGAESSKVLLEIISAENLGVDITSSGYAFHIKDPSVNKGYGLRIAAQMLNVDVHDIAVIGDAENDISMFELSNFGVVSQNADKRLKELAVYVADEPFGEGAAKAIGYILKNLAKMH